MSAVPETESIIEMRRLTGVVFAVLLVVCGSESGSADNSSRPVTSDVTSNVEVLGEITATLNGQQRTWYVTREYKAGRWISESDQSFRGEGTVFFSGHMSKDTTMDPVDMLIFNAHIRSTDAGPDVQNAKITFAGSEIWQGRYGSEYGGEAALQFDTINHENNTTKLVGTFSGTLPFKSNASSDGDRSNVVVLENGRFDVSLVVSN